MGKITLLRKPVNGVQFRMSEDIGCPLCGKDLFYIGCKVVCKHCGYVESCED